MSNEVKVDAESIKKSAEDLVELIKLRTFPFGMKLFENVDDMLAIKGLRTPSDGKFSHNQHFSAIAAKKRLQVCKFKLLKSLRILQGKMEALFIIPLVLVEWVMMQWQLLILDCECME